MVILDKMILTGRLTEFVREFIHIRNEELEDQTRWEFWLHKVFDMTFGEFLAQANNGGSAEPIPQAEVLTATVMDSMGIINGFCPS